MTAYQMAAWAGFAAEMAIMKADTFWRDSPEEQAWLAAAEQAEEAQRAWLELANECDPATSFGPWDYDDT